MVDIPEPVRRAQIEATLRSYFEASLPGCADRRLEISPQGIIPNYHFAEASAECIRLYIEGYSVSTVMVTQAVAEGIRNFIVERNGITGCDSMSGPDVVGLLVQKGIISDGCAEAFSRIYKSFRCDVHHMNQRVAAIPFPALAKKNIDDLAIIEGEIFAAEFFNGRPRPLKSLYWDLKADGTADVYLRLAP
jgi:hypothetical protein